MRPWIIVLAGVTGVFVLGVARLWPELSGTPVSDWNAVVLHHLPEFASASIGFYAFLVLLLSTVLIVVGLVRARFHLARLTTPPTHDGWTEIFAAFGLARLGARVVDLAPPDTTSPDGKLVLQSRFEPRRARREAAGLYQNWLVRAQFFTALAVLLAIAALGWAQDYLHTSIMGVVAPSPILGEVVMLTLLVVFGRLAIDAATEPLLDAIAQLPLERCDITLLRTLAAALDRSREATPEAAFDPTLRRLALALERDRRSLRDAITHLSASAGMVATAARILSERSADIAQHPADVQALVELKSAVEQLTATIVRLPAMAPQARASLSEPPLPNSDPPHNLPVHDLGREVRELLKEFE